MQQRDEKTDETLGEGGEKASRGKSSLIPADGGGARTGIGSSGEKPLCGLDESSPR